MGNVEVRETVPSDIEVIRDYIVEDKREYMHPGIVESIKNIGRLYTYLHNGEIVACVGIVEIDGELEIFALYSDKFPPMTRLRAARFFLRELKKVVTSPVRTKISENLLNGRKYAEHLGLKFIGTEKSKLFADTMNDIYEVQNGA